MPHRFGHPEIRPFRARGFDDFRRREHRGAAGEKWILEEHIGQMLDCCARLLAPDEGAFVVLNLYSMGLSALLARTAMRQAFGIPAHEACGELYFEDPFGKQLPLGIYYRLVR